jgi:hypothetical protein
MDPIAAVGGAIALAATATLMPRTASAVRRGHLPVCEVVTVALLFLSVDWTNGQWPTWQVAAVFFCWATLLVVYPDGRFAPSWAARLLAMYGAVLVAGWVTAGGYESGLWGVAIFGGLAAAAAAQVWRYRRRSSAVEREAAQWLLFGFVITVTVLSTADLVGITATAGITSRWWELLRLVGLALPVSAALGLATSSRSMANPVLHRTAAVCLTAVGLAVLYRVTRAQLSPGWMAGLLAVASPMLLSAFSRLVEPVVYGSGSRAALRRLGQQLQATLGPDDVVVTEPVKVSV